MARNLTTADAMNLAILRRSMGKLGGRPKGVLDKKTIAKIKTKEAMQEIIAKKAGRIIDNLLIGSDLQDTTASKELLERAFGKVPQGVQMQVATFSLKELAEYRKGLQNTPVENALPVVDPVAIALPDALQEPKENDTEKKTN